MSSENIDVNKTSLRLFFALWPDETIRNELALMSRRLVGKRAIKPANLHLTLVFLGTVLTEQRVCYEQSLQGISIPPLQLRLDHLGHWPKPGILWLGPSETPAELTDLVAQLNQRLSQYGFTPERRPFRAHITLARNFTDKAEIPGEFGEPLSWQTNQIVLAKSELKSDGSHYQVLRHWP